MKERGMIINFIVFIIFILSCNDIYKAGNSNPELHIQIETNIDQEIAFKYLDSSKTLIKYNLPERLRADLINGDLKYFPFSNKVIYLKDFPEEAYHLNSNGMLFIQEVFNPSLGGSNWIFQKSLLSSSDFERIEDRIKKILNEVIVLERRDKIPDSIIFLKKPFDRLVCKLIKQN